MDTSDQLNVTYSCHMNERQLFSRLVFSLGMEPSLSMEIIAFWLWLEGNGHADFIRRINSFDDDHVLAIAAAGKNFIETLHLEPNDLNAGSVPNSHFRQAAVQGIAFYLNDVCYKALDDLREKAETEAKSREMKVLVHQMGQAYQDYMQERAHASTVRLDQFQTDKQFVNSYRDGGDNLLELSSQNDLIFKLMKASSAQTYTPYGEGTSAGRSIGSVSSQILQNMMEAEDETQSISPFATLLGTIGLPQQLHGGVGMSLTSNIHDLESSLSQCVISSDYPLARADSFPQSSLVKPSINADLSLQSHPQPHFNVPQDERTLFVTFSNGYPLTKEELYDFFMRHFGDVEEISIEEPTEPRPPLYAHVTFCSLETLLRVLDGNKRVKFMTRGKHLWARQFVPKRKNKA